MRITSRNDKSHENSIDKLVGYKKAKEMTKVESSCFVTKKYRAIRTA